MDDYNNELEFIEHIIESDSRNYSAWGYRKFLVKKFNLY